MTRLVHFAERSVAVTYGDRVSVYEKGKAITKFGTNSTVGTTYETVAQLQSTESNETFVTTNIIDSIVSSSASDTTQTITIEGHTIDGSGNLTFVSKFVFDFKSQCRRDDLICMMYMIIFLVNGRLPWKIPGE